MYLSSRIFTLFDPIDKLSENWPIRKPKKHSSKLGFTKKIQRIHGREGGRICLGNVNL